MRFKLFILFLNIPISFQFFFPMSSSLTSCSSSSCSCAAPPVPACPVQQPCQPIQTCCNSCSSCSKSKRMKREVLSNSTFVADHDILLKRNKREKEILDHKCNSEDLRQIIIEKMDRVTAIAKRRIQQEAEFRLNGRFNIICVRGDLSYVANTELYCQHTVGDVTCFVFKQLSDVVRKRLL